MAQEMTRIKTTFFALLFVVGFTVSAFPQAGSLQNDLQNSLKKFNLIKINNRAALNKVKADNRLIVSTGEKNFELILTPNDLRSVRYRAENQTDDQLEPLEKGEVKTFKGTISGEDASEVRMSIDGTKTEGYFITGGDMFVVEAARKFSKSARLEDTVVYKSSDLINQPGVFCDADVSEKIEQGRQMLAANTVASPQAVRVIELATEADFEFVTALGGAAQANSEILNILNMVEGVYQSELGLTISVVYQHAWSTQDPFVGTTTNTLLVSFKDYWNANFPAAQTPRDAAHLFSAKLTVAGQGLAYVGVTCKNPAFAYGMSGRINVAPVKFELAAHEIAHNFGATHLEVVQSCGNSVMNATLTDLTQFSFCAASRTEVINFVSSNNGCLTARIITKNRFDFDGDGKSDIAVFRPENGGWYITNSINSSYTGVQFGQNGDKPVAADYDGDGKTDIAVYRAGNWYRLNSSNNTFYGAAFGFATDKPVPADYDGDGKSEIAVYRPSIGAWFMFRSSDGTFQAATFGGADDTPLPADFDGDGKADLNIYRPSTGSWYRLNSLNNSFYGAQFGAAEDKPIAGDYDGDGRADLMVWRPSTGGWYVIKSTNGAFTGIQFGTATDVPIAGDYDGDGKTDVAVYRPSNGAWYRLNSTNGAFVAYQFGAITDIPVPAY